MFFHPDRMARPNCCVVKSVCDSQRCVPSLCLTQRCIMRYREQRHTVWNHRASWGRENSCKIFNAPIEWNWFVQEDERMSRCASSLSTKTVADGFYADESSSGERWPKPCEKIRFSKLMNFRVQINQQSRYNFVHKPSGRSSPTRTFARFSFERTKKERKKRNDKKKKKKTG